MLLRRDLTQYSRQICLYKDKFKTIYSNNVLNRI